MLLLMRLLESSAHLLKNGLHEPTLDIHCYPIPRPLESTCQSTSRDSLKSHTKPTLPAKLLQEPSITILTPLMINGDLLTQPIPQLIQGFRI